MKHPISFKKLNKDVSPNLTQQGDYYDAVNGRIIMNDDQTAFAFSNEKGTTSLQVLPSIDNTGSAFQVRNAEDDLLYTVAYTSTELTSLPDTTSAHKIIATCELKERWFVISQESTYYMIWEWDENNTRLQLLYYNNFGGVQYENLRIQTRYENDNTQKLYILDSSTIWHFNVKNGSDTINTLLNQVRAFPEATLDNPSLETMLPGGSFSAGKVQYAYNLYTDSGAETKISPFSQMFNTGDSYFGLDDSENNSRAFKIKIDNIPTGFNVINIYRLFYASATATPEVSLIIEDQLQDTEYTFIDDNNLQESDSSLEAILFLGSDPFSAGDAAAKDNVLFPANIEYTEYNPDFDARAYGWNSSSQALIQDNVTGNQTLTALSDSVAETHDAINPSVSADVGDANYNVYRYKFDGTTPGVEGPNVSIIFQTNERVAYNVDSTSMVPNENSYANNFEITNAWGNMSFKRDEVYRFFIRFTNAVGQKSFAKWIADVRMPTVVDNDLADDDGVLTIKDLGIRVDVQNLPSDAVSWEILREVRTEADKTIKAQGFLNNTLLIEDGTERDYVGSVVSNPFVRCYHDNTNVTATAGGTFVDGLGHSYATTKVSNNGSPIAGDISNTISPAEVFDSNTRGYQILDYVVEFYSPEVLKQRYQFDIASTDYVNFIGGIELSDQPRFLGNANANTIAGASPSTAFSELSVGQNANTLADNRAFIRWNASEGEVFAPGATASATPGGVFYINSYIAAFFDHSCNEVAKVDISGTARFIPSDDERGERVLAWDSGSNNQSSILTNCEMTMKDNASSNFFYGSRVNDRLAFNFDNYNPGTTGIASTLTSSGVNTITNQTANPKIIVVDYKAVVQNQYGGNTYEARQLNNPVVISDSMPVGSTQRVIYGGDTYVSLWNFMRQQCHQGYFRRRTQRENILIPVETSVNLDLRHDEEFYTNLGKYQTTIDDYQLPENVYNRDVSYPISSVQPINYQENNKFDNRVLASDTKVNGEAKDSWLSFRENNFIDLDGTHGGITAIIEDRDQLFTFQPEAVAQLLINPRVQSVDPVGIQLGKGDLLYDYNYMTTTAGSINKYSLVKTPYGIMFYDGINNKVSILNRGEQPISDIKGMNTFFRSDINKSFVVSDNPNGAKGVQSYYDHETKETYMSFQQGSGTLSSTLVYSHLLDGYHFRHDFGIYHPLNFRGRAFWINENRDEIHEHKIGNRGQYFGSYRDSSITFIANPSYINSVFDTIMFNADTKDSGGSDTFNSSIDTIKVYNEHQDTGDVSVSYGSSLKRKFRNWRVNIPRENGTRNRIMGSYAYIKLQWTNAENTSKNIKDVFVDFRPKSVDYI